MRTPISPTLEQDGTYGPSSLALKLATDKVTDYDGHVYPNAHEGNDKVLVICTEEKAMTMANGKKFSTGNHPVETLVPMLHLVAAGYEIEIATPTGAPVQIEKWALPTEDKAVMALYGDLAEQFNSPRSLGDFVASDMNDSSPYSAVYLPGGHGAMLGLPENADVGRILRWAHERELLTMSLCHGPAALLSADLPEARATDSANGFIYDGYEMAVFPDSVDKQTPLIGYMPGHMPWKFGERLTDLGVKIINKKSNGTCHVDRNLITGDGPQAANKFGRMAAEALLKEDNS